MNRSNRRMLFISALIAPVAALLYLYANNAQYLVFYQVMILAGLMVALSALGYGFFRLITKSSASAFFACLVLWIGFFMFSRVFESICNFFNSNFRAGLLYAGVFVLLSIAAAFASRRVRGGVIAPVALCMTVVLFVMNAVPSAQAVYAMSRTNPDVQYKSGFEVDDDLPSPNVYWIHADGMLGFEAMETYFDYDAQECRVALAERGFSVNEDAYLEIGHRTVMAIPALMSPDFYDNHMAERCATHEGATDAAWDLGYLNNELQVARTYSEIRLAFEAREYTTQTMGSFSIFFPPVVDKFYAVVKDDGCYIMDFGEDPEKTYMALVQAGELFEMLTTWNFTRVLMRIMPTLSKFGLVDVSRTEPEHRLDSETQNRMLQGSKNASRYGMLFDAIYDGLHTESPTFNTVYFMAAHAPYVVDETGNLTGRDGGELDDYPAQYRYAQKLLVEMIDMILEKDPDAVIVIQSDHGLHLQTREQITEKLGEDAVLPIWNQVMSAIRVPEKYQNGNEPNALDNPLNMARYLINCFVGENYTYLN